MAQILKPWRKTIPSELSNESWTKLQPRSGLHEMFNHSSREKIYQTLGVTRGYKQAPLPEADCASCPIGKAHRKGLSHKTNMVSETMDVKDGSPQLELSSTVGQTLTVKEYDGKVYAKC